MKFSTLFKHSGIALAILGALSACTSSSGGDDNVDTNTTTQKTGNALASGYLQFATVCLDTTKDNSCADEDASVKTESGTDGSFTLSALAEQYQQFAILAESKADGTTEDDNGQIAAGEKLVLSSPPGKTGDLIVSPLTTIVQGYQQANLGLTTEAAEADIKENLGIESSSAVSLFDDYVAQLQQLSSSPKPIASGAIATGALSNAEVYTLFNQVAQVTTETIQQAIADVVADAASANSVAGIDLAAELDSLIAVVIEDVVESLPSLVVAIGELDPAAEFNAATVATLVTSVGLEIDLTTLADAIVEQEQINEATVTGMQAILNEGLNFFNFDFFSEVFVISRDEITIDTNNASLLSAVSTELDPNNLAAGFGPPSGNGSNSDFYLDATTGWTAEPQNDADGAPVIFNADGSADIALTTGSSFRISGAVSDIAGDFIRDYSAADSSGQSTIPSTSTLAFSNGAKAIRFSGVSLSDEYYLDTFSPARVVDGSFTIATQLSDILGSAIDANSNFVGEQIAFDNNSSNFRRIGIELTGNDLSGTAGTSGTTNFYLIEDTTDVNGNFVTTTTLLPDTSTWTIETIGGETLLTSAFPLAIKTLMQSFDDGSDGNTGILYSATDAISGTVELYRGYFTLAGEAFVEDSWSFNSIAADDVEAFIIEEFGGATTAFISPPLPDTTGLLNDGSGTFSATLFQEDSATSSGIILANAQSYTLGTAMALPLTGAVFDLNFASVAPDGTPEPEVSEVTVGSAVDATTVGVTLTTYADATKALSVAVEQGEIRIDSEGALVFSTLPNQPTGEVTVARFIPIVPTTNPVDGTTQVDTMVVFASFDEATSNLIGQGVLVGTLPPVALQ